MHLIKRQILASVLFLASCASAAPPGPPLINPTQPKNDPPAAAADPKGTAPNDASVDAVLDALNVRGQNLKGFTADVTLNESDDIGLNNTRTGTVRFQQKSADDARIRVTFNQRDDGKHIFPDEKIEYALDNGWLTDRDYKKKLEIRRQVLRPGEKINLLKLGEGPFPLPIGQKKEEVYRLFDVKKIALDAKKDPVGTVHLKLTPKPGSQFARKLSLLDIWVSDESHFPTQIDTVDGAGTGYKSTKFTKLKINPDPPLSDADFTLDKIPEGQWQRRDEPFSE